MEREIAAIVVTYNRKQMLLDCIGHLRGLKKAGCDILVIDNGSTDGTEAALEGSVLDRSIIYYNTGENLGGAGGFQFGIRKAYESGYKYFWLMDDDTFVNEDALYELLEADRELAGEYGFLSSAAYWKDGALCNMNRQHTDLIHRISEDDVKNIRKVEMATFVSFFTRRDVVGRVGLPIKEFFIWSDDLEYSRRISKAYPCYFVPKSSVVHFMEKNDKVGIDKDSKDRLWRYGYLYRNEVYVYRREGVKGVLFLIARVLLHTFRVLKNSRGDKADKIKVIWGSFIKGFGFDPKIEKVY